MKEGSYSWSTQSFSAFDSTVVEIETDEGITGYGETCPLGPSYLAAYAEGARTGIAKIEPDMTGRNPTELDCINDHMDQLLKERFHFQPSAFHDYHTLAIADGGPIVNSGFMHATDAPGLGVEPIMDILGKPVFQT